MEKKTKKSITRFFMAWVFGWLCLCGVLGVVGPLYYMSQATVAQVAMQIPDLGRCIMIGAILALVTVIPAYRGWKHQMRGLFSC